MDGKKLIGNKDFVPFGSNRSRSLRRRSPKAELLGAIEGVMRKTNIFVFPMISLQIEILSDSYAKSSFVFALCILCLCGCKQTLRMLLN
jgi:hypothetical protein